MVARKCRSLPWSKSAVALDRPVVDVAGLGEQLLDSASGRGGVRCARRSSAISASFHCRRCTCQVPSASRMAKREGRATSRRARGQRRGGTIRRGSFALSSRPRAPCWRIAG